MASNFPNTTSYPRKSVRNRNPNVPSRFSSLRQSEVKNRPADNAAANAIHVTMPNSTAPSPAEGNTPALVSSKNPQPSSSATSEAMTRSQKVLRFRAATRNSRATIGKKVMSHNYSVQFPLVERGFDRNG